MPDDASPHHFWKTRDGTSKGQRAETVEPAAKTPAIVSNRPVGRNSRHECRSRQDSGLAVLGDDGRGS